MIDLMYHLIPYQPCALVIIFPILQLRLSVVKKFVQIYTTSMSMKQELNQCVTGLTFILSAHQSVSNLPTEKSANVIGKKMGSPKNSGCIA